LELLSIGDRPNIEDPQIALKVWFKEGSEPRLNHKCESLPGVTIPQDTLNAIAHSDNHEKLPSLISTIEANHGPFEPVRFGYRAFDRQWILPDARLMHRGGPDLWAARRQGQVFVVEQHRRPLNSGPGLVFSALIPDFHYFKGSEGGRVLPFLHPDGTANIALGLSEAISTRLSNPSIADVKQPLSITPSEILAYVAAVVSHPGYTTRFIDELKTPGIRIPITADAELWRKAIEIGSEILRLHTFGEWNSSGTSSTNVRFNVNDERRVLYLKPISSMPATISHDDASKVLVVGDGKFGPVNASVFEYEVGGKNVLKSWFGYRKRQPGGKRTSPLDYLNSPQWQESWSIELIELLSVLTQLVELEPRQEELLSSIMDGKLLTAQDLANQAGGRSVVRWPVTPIDRKPRYSDIQPENLLGRASEMITDQRTDPEPGVPVH
jgi:hypothetical protein